MKLGGVLMKKTLLMAMVTILTLFTVLLVQNDQEIYAIRDPLEFIDMALDPGDYVVGVSLGNSHSSAWTSDGEVWMWGWDQYGKLGDGGTNTDQAEPVEITSKFTVNSGEKIVGVSLGHSHSSAWTSDGEVWMWGRDDKGQLGDGGTNTDQAEPVEITSKFTVNSGEKIVGVSLGQSHSSAWTSDGEVWMWGSDSYGQLGDGGTNTDQAEPVEITSKFTVNSGEKIVGVSLGALHSGAWTSDGEVWMWGWDLVGQLGDGGTNTDQDEPVEITSKFTINSGEKIVGVSLGASFSSAWTSDGEVWMWGVDSHGVLGDGGTNTNQAEPVEITSKFTVNSGEKIVGVSLGNTSSSAWTSDGEVWMWGRDSYGELGDGGTNTNQPEPVEITSKFTVNSGEKIVGVSLGTFNSGAWTSNGEVWMWGSDSYGQLGDGGSMPGDDQDEPVNISSGGDLEPGPTTWTVTYDSNGGSAVSPEEVDDGELATEPTDPTRTHYTFDGWYTDDGVWTDEWDFDTDTVTEDVTLYAKWLLNEWTLYYDSNGGSAKSPDTYDYGETLIEPADPTRSGYYFDGWFYDDSTFLNEVDWGTDTMPDNDVTVYADWSPKPLYTVSFDENGGTAVDDQSVYDEELASEPSPDPTRFMYTFVGWYTN
ncbi:MAG: hypothetical protein EOM21_19610, partial [Gammaproteobacteria bacterium]|nr:hypothetical protein [Gammaproteobacteria bacterium]